MNRNFQEHLKLEEEETTVSSHRRRAIPMFNSTPIPEEDESLLGAVGSLQEMHCLLRSQDTCNKIGQN